MEADPRPSLRLLAPLLGPLAAAWIVVGALIAAHLL
jgi:sorbitol-specific phosphotransferase system component IIBC